MKLPMLEQPVSMMAAASADRTAAVGVAGTPAKYRAAATFTAVDTPTPFGPAARFADDAPSADEEIILTVSVAALPNTAGAKLVVDLYFAGP